MTPLVEKKIKVRGDLFDFSKLKSPDLFRANAPSAPYDYAVIISGGADSENNWVRYWNDCAAIYSTLINIYGYARDHIYVLISDGTDPGKDRHHYDGHYDSSPLDLDGDGINDIQYAATRTNISRVFNILASKLTPSDHLFIYTTDHGGQESGLNVYMCLWNNEIMRDDEFAIEVNKVNAEKINICMEQCRSGGFIDDLRANNRVIATACRHDENSHAMSNLIYDEFVYHWTAAVSGRTPTGGYVNADRNSDGRISMEEAFQYALTNDSRKEHPQYSSTPVTIGTQLFLKKIPFISGPTVVCSQGTYTIQDLPSGTSIQWSTSNGNLQLISGQGTRTAVFSKRSKGQCAIRAQVIINGNTINTEKTGIWVGEPDIWGIDGDESLPAPGAEYYRAHVSGNTSCIWECNDKTWCEITPFQTSAVFDFKRAGTYIISATGVNDCGRSNTVYYTVRVYNRRTFSLFPNPATDVVTLKLTESDDGILSSQGQGSLATRGVTNTYEIQLWNGLTMLRSFKTNQLTFQIPIAGLPAGLYFVRVIKDGQTYTEKLIKN